MHAKRANFKERFTGPQSIFVKTYDQFKVTVNVIKMSSKRNYYSRNRIIAGSTPRMTLTDSFDREKTPFQ